MGILRCCGNTETDSQMLRASSDSTDRPTSSSHVSGFTLILYAYSIVFHCIDVGFDFYVAYQYFASHRYSYGAWSVAFIILPSIVLTLISIRMYLEDLLRNQMMFASCLVRVCLCILGLPVQSATLIRNVDSLYFAIKSRKVERQLPELQAKYFDKMLKEDSDACFLKVHEAYLESAPQQVLQMTLLIVDCSQGSYVHSNRQTMSIVFGFISMSLCVANYNRCIRLDQENKQNLSKVGLLVLCLWHLFLTASRILTISAIASLYALWTCVAIGIHWCCMFIWLIVSTSHDFCPSKALEVIFDFTIGAVYIWNFLGLEDGSKKNRYTVFYSLVFVENTVAVVIWAVSSSFKKWVYYFFIIVPTVCLVLGLIFMIVYYKFVHPTLCQPKVSVNSNTEQRVSLQTEHA